MWRAAACLLFVVATGCGDLARGKAIDLAGLWVLEGGGDVNDARAFCGLSCTIHQDGNVLSVMLGASTLAYAVDGSESHRTTRMGDTATEVVTAAAWGAGKLVITERTSSQADETPEARRMFEIVRRGDQMVVDVTVVAPGIQPRTSQATYTRRP